MMLINQSRWTIVTKLRPTPSRLHTINGYIGSLACDSVSVRDVSVGSLTLIRRSLAPRVVGTCPIIIWCPFTFENVFRIMNIMLLSSIYDCTSRRSSCQFIQSEMESQRLMNTMIKSPYEYLLDGVLDC